MVRPAADPQGQAMRGTWRSRNTKLPPKSLKTEYARDQWRRLIAAGDWTVDGRAVVLACAKAFDRHALAKNRVQQEGHYAEYLKLLEQLGFEIPHPSTGERIESLDDWNDEPGD